MNQIIDAMNWRYATKAFDTEKKLSEGQVNSILESVRLSASSFGLQPWRIVVVKNEDLRLKIKDASWGQTQTTDASHLFIIAKVSNVDEAYVDKFINMVSTTREIEVSDLEGYSQMMKGSIKAKREKGGIEAVKDWSARQAYIALGTLLTICAIEKIDACPMEGFDSKKIDEILGLTELGLESVLMCPIGYRSSNDATANYKKVRFDKEEMVIEK